MIGKTAVCLSVVGVLLAVSQNFVTYSKLHGIS